MKITCTQNIKRRLKKQIYTSKRRRGWTNLKNIEMDRICGFCNLFSLTVFLSSLLSLIEADMN